MKVAYILKETLWKNMLFHASSDTIVSLVGNFFAFFPSQQTDFSMELLKLKMHPHIDANTRLLRVIIIH